jgi:hypothetical protein
MHTETAKITFVLAHRVDISGRDCTSNSGYTRMQFIMWRLTSRFFIGMFATAMLTNAASVYLLHDVDTDRMGKWNLAYRELTAEFLLFGLTCRSNFSSFNLDGNSGIRFTRCQGKYDTWSCSWNFSDIDSISGGIRREEVISGRFCRDVPARLLAPKPYLLCCDHPSEQSQTAADRGSVHVNQVTTKRKFRAAGSCRLPGQLPAYKPRSDC